MTGYPVHPDAQLGVRPAPPLVQQLLVGAFGWMFAGLAADRRASPTSSATSEALLGVVSPVLVAAR